MRTLCILYFCVFTFGSLQLVLAQDSVKIMTYNLEGMKPGTDPATRIYYAVQYLKALDPDIVGLQEINENLDGSGNQAKVIADSLSAHFHIPYYTYIGFTHKSWDNTFNEYVGIITKHPVVQSDYLQLVVGAFPRKVLWNQINTPIGKINFFNTHLDHKTADIRVQQVGQIISYIALKDSTSPALGSVLTGDFNDKSDTPTILSLTNNASPLFVDTYRSANPSLSGYTISAQIPNSRIDYIFYRSNGSLDITSSTVVMNTPYTGVAYPSDHYGVMTVFKKHVTQTSYERSTQQPADFTLYQNYPNPFNPSTAISYYLPQTQHVTLKIYNSLGQLIRILADETQNAGFNAVVWNGRDDSFREVAGGVYYCRLQSNKHSITHKLLFAK